jgi:phage terminase Nu1 subunit (DNA packaging protein)
MAYQLPEGVADADLNQAQLAEALDVSLTTIVAYRTAGMPILSAGANGKAYTYRLSECWAWLQQRRADAQAERERGDATAAQMRMHLLRARVEDDPTTTLPPRERLLILQAELVHQQAAVARRSLIRIDEAAALIEGLFGILRSALDALPDRMEREAGVGPVVVERIMTICDRTLADLRSRIEAAQLREREWDQGEDETPRLPGL